VNSIRSTFVALVLTQVAHSVEEFIGRLWESFPPAAVLTGLVSSDRELGFVILNASLILFGFWCAAVPVRRRWASASALMWFWVVLESINGIGHPVWSFAQHAYTPGVLTAPVLLGLALRLGSLLRRRSLLVSPTSPA
jgi:hypothetical protein